MGRYLQPPRVEDTQGVQYWLCGDRCHDVLEHSLRSLRRVSDLPVQIVTTPGSLEFATALMQQVPGVVIRQATLDPYKRRAHYITKARLPGLSCFQSTLLVDADTLFVRDPTELIAPAGGVVVTNFSGWITTGQIISGRIRKLSKAVIEEQGRPWLDKIAPGWHELLELPHPAINTGVVAYHRDWDWRRWYELTRAAWRTNFTDEIALQALLPYLEGTGELSVVDDRWNRSCDYGRASESDTVIYHFHGRRHVRSEKGRAIWQRLTQDAK